VWLGGIGVFVGVSVGVGLGGSGVGVGVFDGFGVDEGVGVGVIEHVDVAPRALRMLVPVEVDVELEKGESTLPHADPGPRILPHSNLPASAA
jgi:hypothetical protein